MDATQFLLFAQQRGGGDAAGAVGALFSGVMGLVCCGLEVLLLVGIMGFQIWALIILYQTLDACSPRNRDMEPGMVFLTFIPLFNIVWNFFIVLRVASSLQREYRSRGMRGDGDFGKTIGLWALILGFTCIGAPAAPICGIIYIFKIRGFLLELKGSGRKKKRRDEDDDEDDD